MHGPRTYRLALLLWLAGLVATALPAEDDLLCVLPNSATGISGAVRVGSVSLLHTEQAMAVDPQGQIRGTDLEGQFSLLLHRLECAAKRFETSELPSRVGLDRCVKLNVYLRNSDDLPAMQALLAARFMGEHKPAVTFVTTDLPHPDALVAADAVVASPCEPSAEVQFFAAGNNQAACAVLPPGGRVYIAGQAEQGDLATATRKTMQSLEKTLQHLGLGWSNVVQIKSFVMPMSESQTAQSEIRSFFKQGKSPPLVFVEWKSSATTPIEIELIAHAPPNALPAAAPAVEYITPLGMTASPVFARVTRIASRATIYVSGLYGQDAAAEPQVRDIFAQLGKLLQPAGGDLKHLVKATYYVADEPVSAALNKLRPEYYDPQRPPAASKAPVRGVGRSDRTLTLDMIAVPKE